MGYWGTASFENDYSRNILDEFVATLSESIKSGIKDAEVVEWDSYAIDKLVVDMEVFLALVDRGLPIPVFLEWRDLKNELPVFERKWLENAQGQDLHTRRLDAIRTLWLQVAAALEKHEAATAESD